MATAPQTKSIKSPEYAPIVTIKNFMKELSEKFYQLFQETHQGQIRSPLRICPLGAHVDHQGGLVTGMALDVNVELLYAPDEAGFVQVQSVDFPDEEYFHIDSVPEMLPGFWGNYIRGSVLSLARDFRLRKGFKAVIRGRLLYFVKPKYPKKSYKNTHQLVGNFT